MDNSWSSSDTVSLINSKVIPGKVVNGSPVTVFLLLVLLKVIYNHINLNTHIF